MAVINAYVVAGALGDIANTPPNLSTNTPAQLTANKDNWDLKQATGEANVNVDIFRISADAARNLTGIVAPSAVKRTILYNAGSQTITLKHDTTSTAANRFSSTTGADVALAAGAYAVLFYDTAGSRWVIAREVPRAGFKKEIAADGIVVIFNHGFWSVRHLENNASGATAQAIWFRHGTAAPALDYDDDETAAQDQESLVIADGVDELLQIKRENAEQCIWFKPASGAVSAQFRPNEAINR